MRPEPPPYATRGGGDDVLVVPDQVVGGMHQGRHLGDRRWRGVVAFPGPSPRPGHREVGDAPDLVEFGFSVDDLFDRAGSLDPRGHRPQDVCGEIRHGHQIVEVEGDGHAP
jgi:hypothetical protein